MTESIGEMIRRLREKKGEPLRVLAACLQIDQAIMSKIERGQRRITKRQVEKLADYFKANKRDMLVAWLSDQVVYQVEGESLAKEALKVAEEKLAYQNSKSLDRESIVKQISQFLRKDGRINKAWIFGSFARGDDRSTSDIDIMIEEDEEKKFSYFDLADIQYQLEQLVQRKIDIGFASSLKEHLALNIKNEAKLIYEKS